MKNRTINNILNRVSCRAYSKKKISSRKLETIVECGKMAPSACNRQIIKIYAIRAKKYVEKLRTLSLEESGRDCMYGANTIVLVCGPREDNFTVQDASCALENMFIAANALNIQSCWINQFDDLLSTKNGLKIKKLLGIPDDYRIVGSAALGEAEKGWKAQSNPRKDDMVIIK